jgi:acetyl esterase/lipase
LTAYRHLVLELGVAPSRILLVGDSAGGHLALALTRYLRDVEQDRHPHPEGSEVLGLPGGLVLLSPWVDLGFSNLFGYESFNAHTDYVSLSLHSTFLPHPPDRRLTRQIDNTFGIFAASLLLRALPITTMHTSPYISPASLLLPATHTGPASFQGFPPVFLVYGAAEKLSREIKTLWSRLGLARSTTDRKRDKLVEAEDAVHDFMIFPWMDKQARSTYDELQDWVSRLDGERVSVGTID